MPREIWILYWDYIYENERPMWWTWNRMMLKTYPVEEILWFINSNITRN